MKVFIENLQNGRHLLFTSVKWPRCWKLLDRSSFDRIIQSGGYVSVNTGSAPDGNAIPISKEIAENAFDAAHLH